jgi:uncharacterized protein (TIGR03435 family)
MKCLVLLVAVVALMPAQTEKKVEFEVASVKPCKDDGDHDIDVDKGLYRIHNLTLKRMIANAYQLDASEILGGPNWLDSDSFDITAKIPQEFVDLKPARTPEMLQSLLAERFHLTIHREVRQVSGYALVVAKNGPKMEQAKPDAEGSSTNSNNTVNGMHLRAVNTTMERLAARLSRYNEIGQVVVDKTGLTGAFDFDLEWMPERRDGKADAHADDLPGIFTALQEKLGLKLESAKLPIQAIVIDRAEKPEEN